MAKKPLPAPKPTPKGANGKPKVMIAVTMKPSKKKPC